MSETKLFFNKSKFLKDDLRYILFSEINLIDSAPPGKRKAYEIMETAIASIAKHGALQSTLNEIAKKSSVPRSSVSHYFPTLENLHIITFKYIRVLYQAFVLEAIGDEKNPQEVFKKYFFAAVEWPSQFPLHSQAWLAFLQLASNRDSFKKLNTEAVQTGYERLVSIILAGKSFGFFKIQSHETAARAIHIMLTGLILSENTEANPSSIVQRELIYKECLKILGLEVDSL